MLNKISTMTHPIYPCLWFTNNAAEAAEYYCQIFPNSRIISANPMVVHIDLNGRVFMLLNGQQDLFKFNESVSFVVTCDTQEEIDHYWESFTQNGGKESMCGWCSDKYGVSWQVVPVQLGELMSNPERAPRVIEAFLKMRKFDIETLINA